MKFVESIFSSISNQQSAIDLIISRINEVPVSCAAIQQFLSLSPSGYYNVKSSNGSIITVYCDMTRSCGGITGGWMRVVELDMGNTTTQCPGDLELRTTPLRTCGTTDFSGEATCSSDKFSVDGVPYSRVCGRIRAYQVGTPEAFTTNNPNNIDANYVDGVSLTHGSSPRQHIWTFAGANYEEVQIMRRCKL